MSSLLAAQDVVAFRLAPAIVQIVGATTVFVVLVRVIMRLVPAEDASSDAPPGDTADTGGRR
jgi:hypothetical protein